MTLYHELFPLMYFHSFGVLMAPSSCCVVNNSGLHAGPFQPDDAKKMTYDGDKKQQQDSVNLPPEADQYFCKHFTSTREYSRGGEGLCLLTGHEERLAIIARRKISESFRDKDSGSLLADLLPWNEVQLPVCLFNRKSLWMLYATFAKKKCNVLKKVPGTCLITLKQKCESRPMRKNFKECQEKMALLQRALCASKKSFNPKASNGWVGESPNSTSTKKGLKYRSPCQRKHTGSRPFQW